MHHPERPWSWLLVAAALAIGAPAAAQSGLVVHEWGTFTAHHGADGAVEVWQPLLAPSDLPEFVYLAHPRVTKKNTIQGTVRMETPVLYFYADRRTTVSVNVGFPKGIVSEWYPRGRRTARGIRWPRVTILPGATVALPREAADSHYYPARETDAAIVQGARGQREKFLFYRGVGTFDLPLGALLDADSIVVRVTGPDAIARVVLVENRGGQLGWGAHDLSGSETVLPRPVAAGDALASLEVELKAMLVAEGLYGREAQAMVDTWRGTWSEAGLRVLYVVPRPVTDRVLPLAVKPAPAELVRVLVGRVELVNQSSAP